MAQNFFDLLNNVFKLMRENKLKKDIDDTLLEKLLTFMKKCRYDDTNCNTIIVSPIDQRAMCSGFIKELIKRTEALSLIEKVIYSIVTKNETYTIEIRSFTIKFLGLILESPEKIFPQEKLLPLLKHSEDEIMIDHIPSVQDALLICLACITKKIEGALWLIDQNLKDFVFSSFNSSSYYVRKSAANFFVNFISQWIIKPCIEQKKPEDIYLENFLKNLVSFIVSHIPLYQNSREMVFAECCIFILKQLLELENIEILINDHLNLAKNISECFMNLTEEKEFNKKLIDLLLTINFRFTETDEVVKDVIKCLIMKEDIILAIDLASSFASPVGRNLLLPDEIEFFLLPLHILMATPLSSSENYGVKSDFIYSIMLKKINDKSECKALFSSSLSALQKLIPKINSDHQRSLGSEILKMSKCTKYPHKWLYSVLEDRIVHHSLIEFYSCLLDEDVYRSMNCERSDFQRLVFQSILEFLKKPTSDNNFLSQLLLLTKDVLILHKKYNLDLEETEIDDLIQILYRMLHDNRDSVIDSAIHLAGQIINHLAWKDKLLKKGIHSVIWDIAIQGCNDGTIRSTALKVIINGCLEAWFLRELKSSKGVKETDISKILFDLTYDPDFFLQREALSCLFQWMKSNWNELQSPSKDYLYTALVSAVKSLDLELKLTALDVWLWLLENEFVYSDVSPSLDTKEYIEHLINCGFGLSMILAFEDYDLAVQYKAASILCKLKEVLTESKNSFESWKLSPSIENEMPGSIMSQNSFGPFSKEERDKGIDTVMELSTTEQITNICRPSDLSELYDFKQEYFTNDNKDRICSVSKFWTCLWSENVDSVLQPNRTEIADGESLLSDIISARIVEYDLTEDTHDCY